MGILDGAAGLLFPERCPLCRRVVPRGEDVCEGCRRASPFLPSVVRLESGLLVSAVWDYHRGAVAPGICRFKFHGDRAAGRKIARLMAGALKKQRPGFLPDKITFVPMPPQREQRRGYNQSRLLAQWVGEELGVLVLPLLGRRGILTQHQLPASFRRKQTGEFFLLTDAEAVRDRRILLVDDVVTTGSTASACAAVLGENGARETVCLCAASNRV